MHTTRIPILIESQNSPDNIDYSPYSKHHPNSKHPDVITFGEDTPIKINVIRQLPSVFKSLPVTAKTKTVFLLNTQTMTIPAQHASLKILEEHPSYAQIILTTNNSKLLLPTIISRCQHVRQTQTHHHQNTKDLQALINELNVVKKREDAITLLNQLILALRQALKNDPHYSTLEQLSASLRALKLINANTHIALCLQSLHLKLAK